MTAKQIKKIIEKYNFQKDDFLGYSYKLELKNLKITWHIEIEAPTRACKFYSVYTRFATNETCQLEREIWEKINKVIECNTFNGKCNRFCYTTEEINSFIDSVLLFDKNYIETVIKNGHKITKTRKGLRISTAWGNLCYIYPNSKEYKKYYDMLFNH